MIGEEAYEKEKTVSVGVSEKEKSEWEWLLAKEGMGLKEIK